MKLTPRRETPDHTAPAHVDQTRADQTPVGDHADQTRADQTRADQTRADHRAHEGTHAAPVVHDERRRDAVVADDARARDRFGGANWGAGFFGWLVTLGMTALLTGLVAVVATAIGYSNGITQTDAERDAGTYSLVTALVLLAVLIVAYYAGGYVAGRMSRFDGGRQGLAVWVVGLVLTVATAALGYLAGDQYNLLDRVDVPRIPIPSQDVTLASIAVVVAVLLVTLFSAMLGGKVGRRYHLRVDREY